MESQLIFNPVVSNQQGILRAKVPGGWIVREERRGQDEYGISLTFVPDPDHDWK